jgi:hypothetical protein
VTVRRLLVVGVFSLTWFVDPSTHAADPLSEWQLLATATQSIRGLAYKDGTFVAVGFSTNTVVSTNGTNWFRGNNGLTNYFDGLYAVAAGAGRFVAVGPNSTILSSADGLQWTRHNVHTNEEYWAVIYAGGQFVAVGFNSYGVVPEPTVALTSPDGINWQRFTVPLNTTARNIAYGNGIYVAAGALHSMYSTNGRNWTALNGLTATSVAFGNGRFVMTAAAAGYTSTNGIHWTPVTLPDEQYYTATHANGLFMFGSGDKPYALLATSTNGLDWESRTFTAAGSYFAIRDIIFVDGYYYLGDQAGGRIWRSGRVSPVSEPRLTHVAHHGHHSSVSATVVPGFHYAAEYRNDFSTGSWSGLGLRAFAEGELITITDTNAAGPRRFYRATVR